MYIITILVCLFYLFISTKWDRAIREKQNKRNEQTKALERIFKKLDDDLDRIGREMFGDDYKSGIISKDRYGDKIKKKSKTKYKKKKIDEDYVIFEPSPNETAEERRERKDLEEYILYEDTMNNH